jgi:hypothetical protein
MCVVRAGTIARTRERTRWTMTARRVVIPTRRRLKI